MIAFVLEESVETVQAELRCVRILWSTYTLEVHILVLVHVLPSICTSERTLCGAGKCPRQPSETGFKALPPLRAQNAGLMSPFSFSRKPQHRSPQAPRAPPPTGATHRAHHRNNTTPNSMSNGARAVAVAAVVVAATAAGARQPWAGSSTPASAAGGPTAIHRCEPRTPLFSTVMPSASKLRGPKHGVQALLDVGWIVGPLVAVGGCGWWVVVVSSGEWWRVGLIC